MAETAFGSAHCWVAFGNRGDHRLGALGRAAERFAWVSKAVRWTLIVVGGFAAVNMLGVASDMVNTLFIAVIATPAVAMAIAFGVGGIKPAENYWCKILPNNGGSN